jgi:hypothetical protein
MSQKVVQYQAVMQMAQQNPQIYDMVELNKQMLEVLGIKNIHKLVPASEDQKPKDPVSENMAVLNMKPVKAFLYQDHEAHIRVHMAAMQDPKIGQIVGQNPQANAIMAAMQAHIAEHVAFEYRKQIEEQLGVPLDIPNYEDGDTIPEEMEVEISRMMAMAADKLLQKDQAEAAQQQAQQAAQDPIVQMQQKELELKEREVGIKEQKLQIDAAIDTQRLELERERINAQQLVAGLQVAAKTTHAQQELESKMEAEGVRLGMQAVKDRREVGRP